MGIKKTIECSDLAVKEKPKSTGVEVPEESLSNLDATQI
jgi:RNA polymerase nonessential primary-like sigma factor